jgi:protein-disulfide isomerase
MPPSSPPRVDLADPLGPTDHVLGPTNAPVVIVEYGDFECPTCKQAAPAVRLLVERWAGRVCVAFRHFPLEQAHPHALLAAEAAECAGTQGRFWEMHDLLFENQTHLRAAHLREYAERLELDVARFERELDDHLYLQRVREHTESGRRSHVRSTPGFFVNGVIQDVSFGLDGLYRAAEAAVRAG